MKSILQTPNILNQQLTRENFPRFLLVSKIEGNFEKTSPFLISKILYNFVGELKNIRKVKDGLLVETVSAAQSRKLMEVTKLGEDRINVVAHNTLNHSKGIIHCRDFLNCTIEEIKENLASQGVIDVRRIVSKREGILIETPSHILTFNKTTLPAYIKGGFHNLPVRAYIPAPMRCFKCQEFGHTAIRCSKEQICVCGKPPHEGTACSDPITCVNCNGGHSARSRNCPKYKLEMAIQEIKVKEKISYFEAKKKVVPQTPTAGVSYSTATASKPTSFVSDILKELLPHFTSTIKNAVTTELAKVKSEAKSMPPPPRPSQKDSALSNPTAKVPASQKESVVEIPVATQQQASGLYPASRQILAPAPAVAATTQQIIIDADTYSSSCELPGKRDAATASLSSTDEYSFGEMAAEDGTLTKKIRKKKPGWQKGVPRKKNSGEPPLI